MRHCKSGRKFGRFSSQRRAMFNSMLSSLVLCGSIKTTEAKAKELSGKFDRVITKAKNAGDDMLFFRKLEAYLSKSALFKLKNILKEEFSDRNSGYTRIVKMLPRKSDSARMAVIEFVNFRKETGKVEK